MILLYLDVHPWAKDNISKLFPNARLFDGALGVSNEVKRQLINNNLISNSSTGEVTIIDTID